MPYEIESDAGRRFWKGVAVARRSKPIHVGFIPDGNRRWAVSRGLPKEEGYAYGVVPGISLIEKCIELGIAEASIYGFTKDNTKRPRAQKLAFTNAAVAFASEVARHKVGLLVIGDETSTQFPPVLKGFRTRQGSGMKVNSTGKLRLGMGPRRFKKWILAVKGCFSPGI